MAAPDQSQQQQQRQQQLLQERSKDDHQQQQLVTQALQALPTREQHLNDNENDDDEEGDVYDDDRREHPVRTLEDSPMFKTDEETGSTAAATALELEESEQYNSIQQPAGFAPFYTLIEDIATGEHHHPHVHYVFSDDDPDLITNAILREIEDDGIGPDVREAGDENEAATEPQQQPQQQQQQQHRTIIVDVAPNGAAVEGFKSLSHAWQLSSASIVAAPTFNEPGGETAFISPEEGGEAASLMLRLEGVELTSSLNSNNNNNNNDDDDTSGYAKAQIVGAEDLFMLSRRTVMDGADAAAATPDVALATIDALHETFKREMEVLSRLLQHSEPDRRSDERVTSVDEAKQHYTAGV